MQIVGAQLVLFDWAKRDLNRNVKAFYCGIRNVIKSCRVYLMFDVAVDYFRVSSGDMVHSFAVATDSKNKRYIALYSTQFLNLYVLPPPVYESTLRKPRWYEDVPKLRLFSANVEV